jgi:hypothetical protein
LENKEQQTQSKKSMEGFMEGFIGIFVPIRDAVCTPGLVTREINYVEG